MSGVESWIKAPKSGWTGNPAPGAIVEWRNAAGSKGTYLSDDVAGLGQPLNGNSPIKAYRVVTPAALSAIEGGGGSLQPSASVPTEQADGGVLDRDWLVKIIREHSFAQDAADMIIGAMRSATPPATPIAGGFGSNRQGDLPTAPVTDRWADLERLAKAAAKRAPGLWGSDIEKSEGSYGSGDDDRTGFMVPYMETEHGKRLFDAHYCDVAEIHEGYDSDENGSHIYAWDEAAREIFAFLAAVQPSAILELIAAARREEGAGQ